MEYKSLSELGLDKLEVSDLEDLLEIFSNE